MPLYTDELANREPAKLPTVPILKREYLEQRNSYKCANELGDKIHTIPRSFG